MWVIDEWVRAVGERVGAELSEFGGLVLPPAVVCAPLEDAGEKSGEVVGVWWEGEA